KPAAPRAAGERHRISFLDRLRKREEAVARAFQALAERLVDAVPDDIEEAVLAARDVNRSGDYVLRIAQVDDGNGVRHSSSLRAAMALARLARRTALAVARDLRIEVRETSARVLLPCPHVHLVERGQAVAIGFANVMHEMPVDRGRAAFLVQLGPVR